MLSLYSTLETIPVQCKNIQSTVDLKRKKKMKIVCSSHYCKLQRLFFVTDFVYLFMMLVLVWIVPIEKLSTICLIFWVSLYLFDHVLCASKIIRCESTKKYISATCFKFLAFDCDFDINAFRLFLFKGRRGILNWLLI